MTMRKTADELVAEGHYLHERGNMVVILHPSQEWMAVKEQTPFIRSVRIPINGEDERSK